MADVTLMAKLKAMKLTQFSFKSFKRVVSSPNEKGERNEYLTFELVTPVPVVESSKTEYVPQLNQRVANKVNDVTKVSCFIPLIEKYIAEFTFNEDNQGKLDLSGKYEGDMFLDLSKGEDVWLTDTKFSKLSMDWITKGKQERLLAILGKSPDLLKQFQEKTAQAS